MFMIVWGVADFHMPNLMTYQRGFDSEYFVNEIMRLLVVILFPEGRVWQPKAHGAVSQLPGSFSKCS
jgi:hypothetical protein